MNGSLAVNGGVPVRKTMLPYGHQSLDRTDEEAVIKVLRSGWLTTGPAVAEFEEAFATAVDADHAVSFASGTAALHGAAYAAGLKPGDEAITTPMTFAATANSILYAGATPVFADVEDDTLNLDPEAVKAKVSARTKAVVPVDFGGHPADLKALRDLGHDKAMVVIEDACHALGARFGGARVGSVSDLSVFSFHPVKHITTGEGGMVTTGDPALARRLRTFRNHGIDTDSRQRQEAGQWRYNMVDLGFNYRLTDMASALGLSQLAKLDRFLARRKQIARTYGKALETVAGVRLPVERAGSAHAWHLYPVRLTSPRFKSRRDEIIRALWAENIGVSVHYIPVHLHPYYRTRLGTRPGQFPVAEAAYSELLTLPLFPAMTDDDVADVATAVQKVLGGIDT